MSLLFAAGFVVVTYIVLTSQGRDIDHPDGISPAFRVLVVAICVLVALVFATFTVAGLRVALVIDQTGLVIRNPMRTTTVRWESRPHFETRDREQDVDIQGPITTSASLPQHGTITYRYREIVCVVNRQRIWIAATSKMRHRDGVDDLLSELRQAGGRYGRTSTSHAESAE